MKSSPRPWGCFQKNRRGGWQADGLPHARGGVSNQQRPNWPGYGSSPRPWGCFRGFHLQSLFRSVFPTPVGVFPYGLRTEPFTGGLPHARGGVSIVKAINEKRLLSSPRPWGCFSRSPPAWGGRGVFPTPVGVFLHFMQGHGDFFRLPHARGGVSFCPLLPLP